nr:maintenance of telomere capping protein 5 [Quercus suber]
MDRLDDGPCRLTYAFGLSAINTNYVSFAIDNGVLIRHLDNLEQPVWRGNESIVERSSKCVSQLSSIRTNWCAISCGTQTSVRNVLSWALEHKIPGNGRTVTAIGWSQHDVNVLAVGTVDGSIGVWSLSPRTRLLQRLSTGGPASCAIEFSPHHRNVLAACHHDSVNFWSVQRTRRPLSTLTSAYGKVVNLQWNPVNAGILLATTANGNAIFWQTAVTDITSNEDYYDEDEILVFDELDDIERTTRYISSSCIRTNVSHAAWVREQSILVLHENHREILFLELDTQMREMKELVRISTDFDICALDLWSPYGRLIATTYSPHHVRMHEVPPTVFEHIPSQLSADGHLVQPTSGENTSCDVHESTQPSNIASPTGIVPSMKPVSILRKRKRLAIGLYKEVENPSPRLTTGQRNFSFRKSISRSAFSTDSVPRGLTSSLELPKLSEDSSPMPFLSPSIPARKSPATLGLEESLQIPLLPESSLNVSLMAPAHDSDSDDETFGPNMNGSGTLMPGGVNVPLPRMCGALFGPSGQLVVFLPRRRQLIESHLEQVRDGASQQHEGKIQTSKLFPNFGNLIAPNVQTPKSLYLSSTNSDSSASRVALQASSQPSRVTWPVGPSLQTTKNSPLESTCPIDVNVYDVASLLPITRKVAEQCRIFCDERESGADLCRHNAHVMDEPGFYDAANIWRLLSMLLEDSIPLETSKKAGTEDSVVVIAREASFASAGGSSGADKESPGKLRWA